MPRRSRLTKPELQDQLVDLVRIHGTVADAALIIGMSRQAIQNYMAQDAEFKLRIDAARKIYDPLPAQTEGQPEPETKLETKPETETETETETQTQTQTQTQLETETKPKPKPRSEPEALADVQILRPSKTPSRPRAAQLEVMPQVDLDWYFGVLREHAADPTSKGCAKSLSILAEYALGAEIVRARAEASVSGHVDRRPMVLRLA